MKPISQHISLWFGAVMIILITAWAAALSFTNFMDDVLYGKKRLFFILILLAYAIYRGFRTYQILKYVRHKDQ